jgi:hypothetical protein
MSQLARAHNGSFETGKIFSLPSCGGRYHAPSIPIVRPHYSNEHRCICNLASLRMVDFVQETGNAVYLALLRRSNADTGVIWGAKNKK